MEKKLDQKSLTPRQAIEIAETYKNLNNLYDQLQVFEQENTEHSIKIDYILSSMESMRKVYSEMMKYPSFFENPLKSLEGILNGVGQFFSHLISKEGIDISLNYSSPEDNSEPGQDIPF